MIDEFWLTYQRYVFEYQYFSYYKNHQERIHLGINLLTVFVTVVGLSGLLMTNSAFGSFAWSALVLASQIASAFKEQFKVFEKIYALGAFLPEMEILNEEMSTIWRRIEFGAVSDEQEIINLIEKYETRRTHLQHKYLSPIYFPERSKLVNKAHLDTDRLLMQRHDYGGSDKNEKG